MEARYAEPLPVRELAADAGVLDVLWLPGTGKKNRPAGLLRVLCRPADTEEVARAVLRHTHTLGLRRQLLQRLVLPRRATTCACGGASLPAKEYELGQDVYPAGGRRRGPSGSDAGAGGPGIALWEKMKAFSTTCKNI